MPSRARAFAWSDLSLAWRIFLGGTIALVVVLVLLLVLLSRWAHRNGETVVQRELEQSADLVAQVLQARQRSLAGGARVFVQNATFRSLFDSPRREDFLDQAVEAETQLDASWVFIVDQRGLLIAKSDEESASGVDLSRIPLIAGALQGRVTSGFGVSGDSLLFQTVAIPIAVPNGAPLGVLVATKAIDSLLAHDVKEATPADIAFYVRSKDGPRIAVASFDRALGTLGADVVDRPRGHTVFGGARYATLGAAVTTAGGEVVGGYVVMSARDAARAELAEVHRALLVAAAAGLGLLALLALAVDRGVSRPLRAMAAVARRSAEGAARGEALAIPLDERRDELRLVSDAVQALVGDVRDRELLASAVAGALPAVTQLRASAVAATASAQVLSMVRAQGAPAARAATSMPSRAPGEPAPGDVIAGRYRVDALLGAGELGSTFRVRDRVTGSTLALKRLRPGLVDARIPASLDALRHEVHACGVIHRNVVRLHDVGEEAGVAFVTMEYVEGISLATLLQAGAPLVDGVVLALARQLCRALAAAEARGIVHGSLAPRRLLLRHDGTLKVKDYVLARLEREARMGPASGAPRESAIPQLAGATVGAPEYMSPEQLLGEPATTRADLYAAGVVLYECVTGATPFSTDSPLAFLAQKLGDAESVGDSAELPAPRPSRTRTAHVLNDVIARMIAPDAARRARSAAELLPRLDVSG